MSTFIDSGQTLMDFAECIYVRCSNCQKCAKVLRIPSDEEAILTDDSGRIGSWSFRRSFSSRKLSCLHCSHTRVWKGEARGGYGGQCDCYFGLPLWLQTSCCGKILWTFNEEHLSFLERYVTAKHHIKFSSAGWIRNKTIASSLPNWIKLAKNRDEVLKGITKLKAMVEKPLP